MSLLYLSEQLTIYGGFFIILTGTVGNGMNIFIFSSVRNYRRTPCTFFFLAGSINDTIQLLINLTSRILSAGYGIDFSVTSTVWCKTRPFLLTALGMISLTCASLATVGQFLATSRSVSLRRCNNIKWAHRILCVMIIVWCIYGIPNFFYFNISPASKTCVVTNDNFRNFGTTNIFVFLFAVPISVIITFGYLAYRNMHQIRALAREHADRQLTRMVLIQVVLVVVSITPYAIFNAYNTITVGVVKDLNRQLKEYFALTIVSLISYLHFAGSFYMFFISSSRFRRTMKERILWWRRQNQINPLQT